MVYTSLFRKVKKFPEVNKEIEDLLFKAYEGIAGNEAASALKMKFEDEKRNKEESNKEYTFNQQLLTLSGYLNSIKNQNFHNLILLLAVRIDQFERAYQEAENKDYEQRQILEQYQQFAKVLKYSLIGRDEQATSRISHYLNAPNYYPVGPTAEIPKSTKNKAIAYTTIGIGASIILGLVVTAIFCPIAAAAIPFGFLIMALAIAYLRSANDLDAEKIKQSEIGIFENAVNLSKSKNEKYEYPFKYEHQKEYSEENSEHLKIA
ncbi:hypothetical protein [Legionella israelensis]|uniref:23, 7 kDa protein n=1 Tax=Legionella israelensis TaxID=454 RepID=A0A0W0V3K6_9GAMM|nr:hypothetical protein [Legionella israelensis]KTD14705.1 23, 7 kDa protein [Legionella israelensis]QBS10978.1 hypothetical protein E4T55_14685 [Legionella israelensis]SCY30173.1 hypothetical protein SAMN02746069_01954 [Legionella israelensis DSM 19235]STX57972.1 Integral membrane protein (PIN domain superfamily) [Legionella israelensis]